MLPYDVVEKELLFQSRMAIGYRDRFCLILTADDRLALELRHPNTIPTFLEISEFPKSLAAAIQGIRSEPHKSFSFQIPEERPILTGKLRGKAHEETDQIHFGWEGGGPTIYVAPDELTQLLDEIRKRFPES